MKKILSFLVMFTLLLTTCKQAETEVFSVTLDAFTPYTAYPEILNGRVKTIMEIAYFAEIVDGEFIKGERISVAARDTFNWTNDIVVNYDENGVLMQCDFVDENDNIISSNKIELLDGRIHKAKNYVNDTARTKTKVLYNEKGLANRYETYNITDDSLYYYSLASFDENDNVIGWTLYNSKKEPTYEYKFSLYDNGLRSGINAFNKEGELRFEQKFIHNEKGFIKNHILINSKGEKNEWNYSYDYDEMNNWTKSYGSSETIKVITERQYSYYEEE